jgi:delta-aminolevulinic acid dehydratase/porphobilinogen synthase
VAHQILRSSVGTCDTDEDIVFVDSGITGAVHKLIVLVDLLIDEFSFCGRCGLFSMGKGIKRPLASSARKSAASELTSTSDVVKGERSSPFLNERERASE